MSLCIRASAHGAMGRRIYTSWRTHGDMSPSSQCSETSITKAVVSNILSVGMLHIKYSLLLVHAVASAGFLSR